MRAVWASATTTASRMLSNSQPGSRSSQTVDASDASAPGVSSRVCDATDVEPLLELSAGLARGVSRASLSFLNSQLRPATTDCTPNPVMSSPEPILTQRSQPWLASVRSRDTSAASTNHHAAEPPNTPATRSAPLGQY